MNPNQLLLEATKFRKAIEGARDAGEFKPEKPYQPERKGSFPEDCCNDTADLFIHYLYPAQVT